MTDHSEQQNVWIFHGAGASFASGVFASRDDGMAWIARHRLTGILTEYPVGDVDGFSPRHSDHVHVRDGIEDHHYGEE